MNGAIFYASKYGSTAEYANWVSEATGLPVFNTKDHNADPAKYDFLIIGSPVIYYKLLIQKWVKRNLSVLEGKPIVFFSVSGAPAGPKLSDWITNSLPKSFISKMYHVALRGRQIPKELTLFDRLMLIIAGMKNPDPVAKKEEMEGFDYMDKSSIAPIIKLVEQFKLNKVST
ncbi:menaquinone-dependent protoporphyrinogen IX oxidase [Saonia flava]|uniref:Menaquinone-dependent protoporphyrinogen IX oxidase n=1 Tax=Saonia flava TaxID=523696 RepID=A0A846QSB3_9FLAO|nr:flavodoxin domain-containing protein [Saonia flava]NJB69860.1 menaquinone-dependent protoporphyrinogen IX oxidase [Saonia flava]